MSANRYGTANADEKKTFKTLASFLVMFLSLLGVGVLHRELRGNKKAKFIFALKKNNPLIHAVEFLMDAGENVKMVSLLVSKVTKDSKFGRGVLKLHIDARLAYGGVVVRIPIENQEELPTLLENIGKLAAASEELELDPKRTYFDPPQGWLDVKDNAPPKKAEKAKKETKKEEVETPTEAPVEVVAEVVAPTAEEIAKEDMKEAS